MSAIPMVPVSLRSGRLRLPPPELSWRTRRDIMLTSTLALPTFSRACLTRSAFMVFVLHSRIIQWSFCNLGRVDQSQVFGRVAYSVESFLFTLLRPGLFAQVLEAAEERPGKRRGLLAKTGGCMGDGFQNAH